MKLQELMPMNLENCSEIEAKFLVYLKYYVNSIKAQTNLDSPEIKYSALQYFTDILLTLDLDSF